MSKKIISYLAAIVLFASCLMPAGAVFVSAATVSTLATGDYYIYSGVGSDKVLDVSGSSKTNGANVIINKYAKSASQVFHVTNLGNGTITIQNKNSGLMLDVYAASTASGTNVWQYASNNSNAQKWSLMTTSRSGYYAIKTLLANNVLDVYGASNVAGSNVWVYQSNNTAAQQWKFVSAQAASQGGSSNQGTTVTTNKRAGFASGYYMIQSKVSPSRYLEVANDSLANGGNIQLGPTGQTASRVFYLTNLGSGNFTIENALSGKMMDLKDSGTDNGTNIQQYSSNGMTAQKWYISSTRTDGYYTISTAINHKKVVDVNGGNSAPGTNISIYTLNKSDAQYWKFVKVSRPAVSLKDGIYVMRSCLSTSYVVSVPSKSTENNANVALYRNAGNNFQKWQIMSVGNGYYKVINMGSKKALHVVGAGKAYGTNVVQYTWRESKAQKWKLSGCRGIFTLTNMANGLALDVSGGSAANNANIQMYGSNGTRAQKFRLEATTYTEPVTRTSTYVKDPATGKMFQLEAQYLTDPVMGRDVTEEDFLAAVLYTEAGDQGTSGMMMVGYVIENRLEAGKAAAKAGRYVEYPGTLDIMIYQTQQWEVARNGTLTRVLQNIVSGSADYLANARSAAKKVLAKQNIVLETTATIYTKTGTNTSQMSALNSGTSIKASGFNYNSFMTPGAWNRFATDGRHYKFASGYGNGKNTLLYRGHVFFMDEELW
ncbi:MAG: RICIN domain-containing protein [Lachnospiraceae bacterium]|nr:RICIN domain-containing protein [Lachnospiraceae bacterium]